MPAFRALLSLIFFVGVSGSGKVFAQYVFESKFGSFGSQPGKFDDPQGVTIDNAGQIVLGEALNNRISICSDQGVCSVFGSFGSSTGRFDGPYGVAVNSLGRIFIADRFNDRIQSCSAQGSCSVVAGSGTSVGKFQGPRGITVTPGDMLVIADTDNDRIQICSDEGDCTAFGSSGSALGQFNGPSGVAVDSQDRIIVADRGNHRIQVCSMAGQCTAFGSVGEAVGQFEGPSTVALDIDDQIVVADRANDRIQICSDQGVCSAFGQFGGSDGSFFRPWGVAVDEGDRIIVSDTVNNRVQIFAPPFAMRRFTISAAAIQTLESVTLSWRVNSATSCTPLGGNAAWQSVNITLQTASVEIPIDAAGDYTFTLECTDGVDTDSMDVMVTVTNPPVSIDSFSGSVAAMIIGETVTLSWLVNWATSCMALNGTAAWTAITPDAESGQAVIQIDSPGLYTFTLECTDGIVIDSADVMVNVSNPPVSIDSFSTSLSAITIGDSITLSWAVSWATSCTGLGGTADWAAITPDPVSGNAVVQIDVVGEYTFTLECTDGVNTDSAAVMVTANNPPVSIDSFGGSAAEILTGESVTLSWAVSWAISCTALGGTAAWTAITPDSKSGQAVIQIDAAGDYTFTLECTDGVNTDSAAVMVTVTDPPPVNIDSFTASAAVITEGHQVMLSWTVSNAESCTALGGTPAWTVITPDAESGSANIQIDVPGEYTFTLECADGENTESANVMVTVVEEPVAVIDSFTGSAAEITTGESVTLNWTVSDATFCTALGGTADWAAITPDSSAGNAVVQIDVAGEYTFTLECTDGENTVSADVMVSVVDPPQATIDSFNGSAAEIVAGQALTLSWAVSDATSCTSLNGTPAWTAITPDAASGQAVIQMDSTGDFIFTLECTDGENTDSASVGVTVTPPPVSIDAFSSSLAVITIGESITLSWTVSNATSCLALDGTPAWAAISPDVSAGNAVIQIDEAGTFIFTLECTDGETTDSATVQITAKEPGVSIDSFSSSLAAITTGESVVLSWSVTSATSCTALGGTPAWTAINPDTESGQVVIQIDEAGAFIFTLECSDSANTDTANVLVNVSPPPPVSIDSFTISASEIEVGASVTLIWTVSNATSCATGQGTPDWQALKPDSEFGSVVIRIDEAGDYTFVLRCTDDEINVRASVRVTVFEIALFAINAGLNDAWFNSDTAGQGFFIIVFKDTGIIFLAWFTYDTERPDEGVMAMLGEAGHRWLTAQGPFDGDTALLDIFLTQGGVFDSAEPQPAAAVDVGDMTIVWHDCERATLTYGFPDLGLMGQIELSRIVPDNVLLCETLQAEAD